MPRKVAKTTAGSTAKPTAANRPGPGSAKAAKATGSKAKVADAKPKAAKPKAAKPKAAKPKAAKSAPAKTDTGKGKARTRSSSRKTKSRQPAPAPIPRAMPVVDDDDALMAHGAGGGAGYGRCGGRMLGSRLEQVICDRLSDAGVAHSHSPRHFEVSVKDQQVAAYAPMVVLRGRGREGKSVVLESTEEASTPILKKVVAFRAQYSQEYYIILIAPEEVLEEVPLATYDEACAETDLHTLIARLAE